MKTTNETLFRICERCSDEIKEAAKRGTYIPQTTLNATVKPCAQKFCFLCGDDAIAFEMRTK